MANGIGNIFGQLTSGIASIAQSANGVLEPVAATLANWNAIKGAASSGVGPTVFVSSGIAPGPSSSGPSLPPAFFPQFPSSGPLGGPIPGPMAKRGTVMDPVILALILVGGIVLVRRG